MNIYSLIHWTFITIYWALALHRALGEKSMTRVLSSLFLQGKPSSFTYGSMSRALKGVVLDHWGPSDTCVSPNSNFACLLSCKGVTVPNFLLSVRNIHNYSFIKYLQSTYYMLGSVCGTETLKSFSVVCVKGHHYFGRCTWSSLTPILNVFKK